MKKIVFFLLIYWQVSNPTLYCICKCRIHNKEKMVVLSSKAVNNKEELIAAGKDLEDQFTANLTKEETAEYIRLSRKIME